MTAPARGGSPHWRSGRTVPGMMAEVCAALAPGLLCCAWLFGWGVLVHCALAVLFALLLEAVVLRMRRLSLRLFLGDGSAVVTALLFALSISPLSPWWVSLAGMLVAIVLGKHLFGGLGCNVFNPAMLGYAFVLTCFPTQAGVWPQPVVSGGASALGESLGNIFLAGPAPDALSGATPLMEMKTRLGAMDMVSEITAGPLFGYLGGAGWEWLNLSFLAGGGYLLWRGVIRWHIPAAVLVGVLAPAALLHLYDGEAYASPWFHLFSGGTMLCAFFIATDPVTAAAAPRGRLAYGALAGLLLYLLRAFSALPGGAAFAVLIANAAVPLIDLLTRPRVFGEDRRG